MVIPAFNSSHATFLWNSSFGELFSFLWQILHFTTLVQRKKNSFAHCVPFVKSKQNSNSAVGTWIPPWTIMNCKTNYVAIISYCNFVLVEDIGNYLQSHFYLPCYWLKNNQSRATISTTAIPPYARTFFKLTSLFGLLTPTMYMESWLLTKQITSLSDATYEDSHPMRNSTPMGTQTSPSSSLWICKDQPAKLHGAKRTITWTNAIIKSAENTFFFNSSSFFYLSASKYKPFFSTKLFFSRLVLQ